MISKVGLYSQPKVQENNLKSTSKSVNLGNTVSFKGADEASVPRPAEATVNNVEFMKGFVTKGEIRIDNILTDLKGRTNLSLGLLDMEGKTRDYNPAGLNIETKNLKLSETNGYDKEILIKNQKKPTNTLAVIRYDSKSGDIPQLTYKQGKYMPEITVKDNSLGDTKVKMLAGSVLIGNDFEVVMPGQRLDMTTGKYIKVSQRGESRPKFISHQDAIKYRSNVPFSGKIAISTLNKEQKTQDAVNKYMDKQLYEQAIPGDYADIVRENDPAVVIPAGGFGERFYNLTRDNENKPSYRLPTDDGYRIIATSLNMAASAGALKAGEEFKYLSQNNEIEGSDVAKVERYKTDGGAIAEGLQRDIIENNKDLIVLNADIFTNADASIAYKALKTLPDAALVIPYYPVNSERAKSFGLLGVEKDDAGNLQIKNFLEKPQYTSEPPENTDFRGSDHGEYDKALESFMEVQKAKNDNGEFLANPGMYFMSKEAAKVLMANGISDLVSGTNTTGLGASVMPAIVKLCNEGKLKTEDGRPMKVYTVPLQAKGEKPAVWDDIGTAEAYISVIRDVAKETAEKGTTPQNKYYGIPNFVLEDFVKNTDFSTGVVYDSPEAKKDVTAFKEAKGVKALMGNIYVAK